MAANIEPDLVRDVFQLTENPFSGRFQLPLEPEKPDDLEGLYAIVDGLQKSLANIEDWTATLGRRRREACVALISGPKGSGRSSAAKYLGFRCTSVLMSNASPLPIIEEVLRSHFIERDVQDEHQVAPVADLLTEYLTRLFELGISPTDAVVSRVAAGAGSPHRDLSYYKLLVPQLRSSMPAVTPIFCLENIRNLQQILAAVDAFGGSAIVICTTTSPSVRDGFSQEAAKGRINSLSIELGGLEPSDVCRLLEKRWRSHCTSQQPMPAPVTDQAIEVVFTQQWPIRGVILMFAQILDDHAQRIAVGGATIKPLTTEEMNSSIIKVLGKRAEFVS